jgi:cyclohexanecarboxyl-CoA dehydrogenase
MDFDFTPEQSELRATVRRFAEDVVAPLSRQMDRDGRVPPQILTGLAEMGVLGMMLHPDDGGGGASSVDAGIAVEELARADFVVGQLPIMGSLTAHAIAQASASVKDSVLPALVEGRSLIAFALTESGAGSDAMALACRAERTPTGYRLNGEKTSISNIGHASGVIVLAKVAGEGHGGKVTAFFVPVDRAGASVSLFEDLGCRALTRGALLLEDVEVSDDERIGDEGSGFALVMKLFDLTRTLIALAAVATATASIEDGAAYARDRNSFGVPIAAHQGVSFRLAEHATFLEAARWLCYRALWLRDAGRPHTTEAAMSKWWGVVAAVDAIHEVMLIHGHSGYTTELPHEQRLRDVMGMEWGDGTAQIQKLVIARALIGRDAVDARLE